MVWAPGKPLLFSLILAVSTANSASKLHYGIYTGSSPIDDSSCCRHLPIFQHDCIMALVLEMWRNKLPREEDKQVWLARLRSRQVEKPELLLSHALIDVVSIEGYHQAIIKPHTCSWRWAEKCSTSTRYGDDSQSVHSPTHYNRHNRVLVVQVPEIPECLYHLITGNQPHRGAAE